MVKAVLSVLRAAFTLPISLSMGALYWEGVGGTLETCWTRTVFMRLLAKAYVDNCKLSHAEPSRRKEKKICMCRNISVEVLTWVWIERMGLNVTHLQWRLHLLYLIFEALRKSEVI